MGEYREGWPGVVYKRTPLPEIVRGGLAYLRTPWTPEPKNRSAAASAVLAQAVASDPLLGGGAQWRRKHRYYQPLSTGGSDTSADSALQILDTIYLSDPPPPFQRSS